MESSLSKHITELNKLSYKDQCVYIAKNLISMEPDDEPDEPKLVNIYDGNSIKKKSDLVKMIIYECMNGKLKNKRIEDISINKAYSMLKENDAIIKSLPGYGNLRLRKKDLKPYVEDNKPSVNIYT